MTRRALVALVLLVQALDVSVLEFVELQALPDDARRSRFGLPGTCSPRISATAPAALPSGRVLVIVECGTDGDAWPNGASEPLRPVRWE